MENEWNCYDKWIEIRDKLDSLGIRDKYEIYILESLEEYRIKDKYKILNKRDVLSSEMGFMLFTEEKIRYRRSPKA